MKTIKVHVRRLSDREIVHSVEVNNPTERKVERVVAGMLRNMNTDEFFVDDSEADPEIVRSGKCEGGGYQAEAVRHFGGAWRITFPWGDEQREGEPAAIRSYLNRALKARAS
jgi:hypothetical protein